jgi:uncharacterized lipoprotein YddW (UPF0748 family)
MSKILKKSNLVINPWFKKVAIADSINNKLHKKIEHRHPAMLSIQRNKIKYYIQAIS